MLSIDQFEDIQLGELLPAAPLEGFLKNTSQDASTDAMIDNAWRA
jgi:hypothetical protein